MTSQQVDRISGLGGDVAVKAPCRVATTAAITLSGLQTVDGIALVDADRVLVKNQSDTTQNGIYLARSGTWDRSLDFDGGRDIVNGSFTLVLNGVGAGLWRVSATDPVTPGTTAVTLTSLIASFSLNNALTPSGAKGDGVTDDWLSLQTWLNAIPVGGAGYLPPAQVGQYYKTTLPLTRTGYVTIFGDGLASRIHYTGSGVALTLGPTSGPRFSRLQNFFLTGTGAGAGGIDVLSAQQGYFDTSVRVEGFTAGFGRRFSSSWTGTIIGGSSHGNLDGIRFTKVADGASVAYNNSWNIWGHDCSNCSGIGIDLQRGFMMNIIGCDFSTTGTGIELGRALGAAETLRNLTVLGNYFESTNCIYVGRGATGGAQVVYCLIDGNYLAGVTNGVHLYASDSVRVMPQSMAGTNTIDAGCTGTQWSSESNVTDNATAGQTNYLRGNTGFIQFNTIVAITTLQAPAPTVANLGAATLGKRATVSDSNVAYASGVLGNVVVGGGANKCPVWADGSSWRIG